VKNPIFKAIFVITTTLITLSLYVYIIGLLSHFIFVILLNFDQILVPLCQFLFILTSLVLVIALTFYFMETNPEIEEKKGSDERKN